MDQVGLVAAPLLGAGLPGGAGLPQFAELGLALLLSGLIGLEREIRQKSAGLRTYTLVGVGAALFTLVSKYGFADVLAPGRVVVDPSRVAAQIVTGVGFLGAGLIFVQRGSVRGLTTAAAVWVTAAIGAAAGAGLPVLAAAGAAVYFVVATVFRAVTRSLPRSATAISAVHLRYPDGRGVLRQVLAVATARGFVIDEVATEAPEPAQAAPEAPPGPAGEQRTVEVTLHVHGRPPVTDLAAALSEIDQVQSVRTGDVHAVEE